MTQPRIVAADVGTDEPDVDWYIDYAIVKDPLYNAKRVIYRVNHCGSCDTVVWTIMSDPERTLWTSWAAAWQAIREGDIEWTVAPAALIQSQHPAPVSG